MRKLAVVVGLLLISSVADANEYRLDKKAYCERMKTKLVVQYDTSRKSGNPKEIQALYLDRANKTANVYNALCKD